MKKSFLLLLVLFESSALFSQNNLSWGGYFSYNAIKDLTESPVKLTVASENALFTKNLIKNDLTTINTLNGLSGQPISAIYYSETFKKTVVGYESGLVIIINADGSMFNAIGILQKQIPANIKKINHFYENNGIVYLSCNFGIVQFNLTTLEFGDTYFLGSSVSDYIETLQTTVFNNAIYAVTRNNGIKKGLLSNPNLNDYSQWQVFDSGYWNGIATLNNQLVAANNSNTLYHWTGTFASAFYSFTDTTVDFRVYQNRLIATSPTKIVVFNNQFNTVATVTNTALQTPSVAVFTCATQIENTLYVGTLENGLFATSATNPTTFYNSTPDGPARNALFGIKASGAALWAVYGGYSGDYNPYTYNSFNVNSYGISKYTTNGWLTIPYNQVLGAKALTKITVNPNNANQVYVSSFFSGLLKLDNDVPTLLYKNDNSTLESMVAPNLADNIRINGSAFDKSGNLWVTNSRVKKGLKVLKTNNTWQSVALDGVLEAYADNDYGNIVVDKNGTKWMATSKNGVVAYNENGAVLKKITMGSDLGNLPVKDARVVALDTKNQLWIGTITGLRVLTSVDSFLSSEQMTTKSIIILEAGLAQELFYEQSITDIVVDGANRKWVGTADSGVFLVSSDGQETVYHFTSTNSPLPSNTILDVEVNSETGEVYFATDKGMISFKGTSTKGAEDLSNVYVYPNPVRPEFSGTVKVSGLLDKAVVKITDIEGNLVYETTAQGGTIEWDTTAFGNYKVASGVYMVFISSQDGAETKVKKIMIIR